MVGQAIDATLGELLTAGFAGVLIAVTGILELLTSNKKLEDQLVWLATHRGRVCDSQIDFVFVLVDVLLLLL